MLVKCPECNLEYKDCDDGDDGDGKTKKQNVEYVKLLRMKALLGIEKEKKNLKKQGEGLRKAFTSAATAKKGTDESPGSIVEIAGSGEVLDVESAAANLEKEKEGRKRKENSVVQIILYLSVLMAISAVIVRLIYDYAPV